MKLVAVFLAVLLNGVEPQVLQTPDPDVIEAIEVTGNRRIPSETILYNLQTRPGEPLVLGVLQRDIRTLYGLGYFQDIRVDEEDGENGKILIFDVVEKPIIRAFDYEGNDSVTLSTILERNRDAGVGLTVEIPYDETRVQLAKTVLLGLLAEQGRQNATVEIETYDIPPNAIGVAFVIDEGPKIKIEEIEIIGNEAFSDGQIKGVMELIKEAGPISSFRSQDVYHELKMNDDITRIQMLLRENGYVRAVVLEPEVEIRSTKISRTLPFIKPSFPWGIPLPFWKKDVDRFFIKIQVEENDQYRLGDINVTGNEQFTEEQLISFLRLNTGEVFNETRLREGFEDLSRLYGNFGFVNFTPVPTYDFDDESRTVDLTINVDEDRQFFVNRINFRGNTSTRDKVIRREVMLEEGKIFSSQLWDMSLLRLNQLGYFEQITPDAADIQPNPVEAEVDITLNVEERGGNTIGFSGGVSAIGGTFLGIDYSTNNFLGFGETLAVTAQGGTRQSNYSFSFTEPYLMDRPISSGFSIFKSEYRFDQARDVFGLDVSNLPTGYGFENRLNYEQSRKGFNVFTSYPLRVFQRLGLTFQFDNSSSDAVNPATSAFFDNVRQSERGSFVQTGGSFSDFKTRSLISTYSYNRVDNPNRPSTGQSINLSFNFTGSFLGGNVNYIQPFFEYQFYRPMNNFRNTLAFRFQAGHLRGFSGTGSPFYQRYFMGGDFDVRGFEFRSISPMAFVTRESVDDFTGQPIVIDDIAYVGGDTTAVANLEYRIPIAGEVLTLAPFLDIGNSWAVNRSQLQREVVQPDGSIRVDPVEFIPGTNVGLRASTGVELQVLMPVINAPFRLIYFYNALRLDRTLKLPASGQDIILREQEKGFKFTVGKTF
jgi:outer membrane protein insertion porin family